MTTEQRFWSFVDRRGPDECWEWTGGRDPDGYGIFSDRDRHSVRAHRFVIVLVTGEQPVDKVLHHCDNPPCVNPAHLYQGSQFDNERDKLVRGHHAYASRTHCKNGHEFTPKNTRWRYVDGHRSARICRACARDQGRRRRAS